MPRNREIRESFHPRKTPAIRYSFMMKNYEATHELYERVETQMTNQPQCNHGQWPEANVGQWLTILYTKGNYPLKFFSSRDGPNIYIWKEGMDGRTLRS